MSNHFCSADILLPKVQDYSKWAVIACDQYTSDPTYWENVEKEVGVHPSTLHMIIPEAQLHTAGNERTQSVCQTMKDYIAGDLFDEYPNSFVYLERTLQDGSVRQGIVGAVDLDTYDYDPKENTRIFATEQTVLQRVPPRVAVRKEAELELTHVVMFCDDPAGTLIEAVAARKDRLPKLYDFDLMAEGGHITGWLLEGENACAFDAAIASYEREKAYLVGDGNHSLVTAKLCYEDYKAHNPEQTWKDAPARFALVELENIHSNSISFEPIFRIVSCKSPEKLASDLTMLDSADGTPVTWHIGNHSGVVKLPVEKEKLPIETLQAFLDNWLSENEGVIDYIHGEAETLALAQIPGNIGLLVADLGKQILFPYVLSGKVMPRKTFSVGHAAEKRYYLEGRKIK